MLYLGRLQILICLTALINLLNHLLTTCLTLNIILLICKPTRIIENKHSAIDHIWTNITNNKILSGIITHSIADHLPIIQIPVIGEITYEKNVMRCFTQMT